MELQAYLETIHRRLEAYFDIERPYEYHHEMYDLYARSDIRNERYFASKKIKVYAIENKEHVFLKKMDVLTQSELDRFWQALVRASDELPEPHEEHMSTIINGIVVTEEVPDANQQTLIQRKKHEKSFMLGLRGWVYVRLLVVNLKDGTIIHNKRGKEVVQLYSPKTSVQQNLEI